MQTSRMRNFKKISVIIVNYKSQARLLDCIASVYDKLKNENIEIVIVNNDPKENVSEKTKIFSEIRTINLGKNVGFGTAINRGAEASQGEWMMFLNPDTKLLTDQQKMFEFLRSNPKAGIISPKLVKASGKVQEWSAGSSPGLIDLIGNNIGFSKSKKIWESNKTKEVDWTSGAAMVIKKDLFDKIGGFDENIFMYFEDIDLCKRAREAGKKVFYFPQDEVLHLGGKSTENEKKQKADYYKSQDYYFQKHFSKTSSAFVRVLRKIFIKA